MREKGRRKKGRTWAEAARTVLEKYPNTPMSHKEILQVIQKEGLKEISGTSPLACLNAMLHTNSRGEEGIFYKVPGRMGVYTLKKDVPDGLKELSDGSEESSDAQSDSQSSENSSSSSSDACGNKDGRRSRWKRKVSSRLSQAASPPAGCPSPSVPPAKGISPSQKHSKKALKQALKQQQQKQQQQQQCRAAMPVSGGQHVLLKAVKAAGDSAPPKAAWEGKQAAGRPSSLAGTAGGPAAAVKLGLAKKPFQRSDRLHARQLKRTKGADIDVETPDSILVNTNLRALINKHTFSALPAECQQRLLLLLPELDRQVGADGVMKLSGSALNNEFFTSAAQAWKERLSEGEFTPEMQLRIRQEIEKEKKVELWKERFFESYYGQSSGLSPEESRRLTAPGGAAGTEDGHVAAEQPRSPAERPPAAEPGARAAPAAPRTKGPEQRREDSQPRAARPAGPSVSAGGAAAQPGERSVPRAPRDAGAVGPEAAAAGRAPEEEPPRTAPKEPPGQEPASSSPVAPSKAKSPEAGDGVASGARPAAAAAVETPKKKPPANEEMEVSAEGYKRKAESRDEAQPSPEKKARVAESHPPPAPPRGQAQPCAATTPRVPPLKIPVSRLAPMPFPGAQVSPRARFAAALGSPCRTGARTLADIKARAQQARAQRAAAAAAAAAGGSVPGPGPGGGGGGAAAPVGAGGGGGPRGAPLGAATATQAPAPAAARPPGAQLQPGASALGSPGTPPAPSLGRAPAGPGKATGGDGTPCTASGGTGSDMARRECTPAPAPPACRGPGAPAGGLVATGTSAPSSHVSSVAASLKSHGSPGASGALPKGSSSIPANNPLVTQLLQGKDVPLEQILPRPLAKAEPKAPAAAPREDRGAAVPGADRADGAAQAAVPQLARTGPHRALPSLPRTLQLLSGKEPGGEQSQGHETLSKATQEQILQTLIKRVQRQNALPVAQAPPLSVTPAALHAEHGPASPRFVLGFVGRRTARPAMSGHYLLNISTYGRGSESFRRGFALNPESRLCLSSPADAPRPRLGEREETPGDGGSSSSEEGDADDESTGDEQEGGGTPGLLPGTARSEAGQAAQPAGRSALPNAGGQAGAAACQLDGAALARGFLQAAQAQVAQAMRGRVHGGAEPVGAPGACAQRPAPPRSNAPTPLGGPAAAPLLAPSYSGTINVSTAADVTQGSLMSGLAECNQLSSSMGNVMSFSVTVTTIPSSQAVNSGGHGQSLPAQAFAEDSGMEDSPAKCYCRLKAMIMCKGCGAFCHDDCIGPSKLCVSCLVVR
ncbi:putative Polycomb group protein ASXL2 [Eudromia elegans]